MHIFFLWTFRSFILRLEDVDPKKMENEEKLAFWVNIHNALVMHVCLFPILPKESFLINVVRHQSGLFSIWASSAPYEELKINHEGNPSKK